MTSRNDAENFVGCTLLTVLNGQHTKEMAPS